MAAAPSRPSKTTSLPHTLLRMAGPNPHEDNDCLVCWEPLAETPTIEHVGTADLPGCGRRFHEDCLLAYYREAAQHTAICLVCRAPILGQGETTPWRTEVPEPPRLVVPRSLQQFWQQWAFLRRKYVGGSPHNICAVFQAALPCVNADDLEREIMGELTAAYESINIGRDLSHLRTLSTEKVIFLMIGMEESSLVYLYALWRFIGARDLFLVQADAYTSVDVWVPVLPIIRPVNLATMRNPHDRTGAAISRSLELAPVPGLVRLPISTNLLCDLIHRFHDMTPAENSQTQANLVRETAARDGVTPLATRRPPKRRARGHAICVET